MKLLRLLPSWRVPASSIFLDGAGTYGAWGRPGIDDLKGIEDATYVQEDEVPLKLSMTSTPVHMLIFMRKFVQLVVQFIFSHGFFQDSRGVVLARVDVSQHREAETLKEETVDLLNEYLEEGDLDETITSLKLLAEIPGPPLSSSLFHFLLPL